MTEEEKVENIKKLLGKNYKIIDADGTYFASRGKNGSIDGTLDNKGNIRKLVVEKHGERNKLFWGKNALHRAKKYLENT